jgi:hypothetical protein
VEVADERIVAAGVDGFAEQFAQAIGRIAGTRRILREDARRERQRFAHDVVPLGIVAARFFPGFQQRFMLPAEFLIEEALDDAGRNRLQRGQRLLARRGRDDRRNRRRDGRHRHRLARAGGMHGMAECESRKHHRAEGVEHSEPDVQAHHAALYRKMLASGANSRKIREFARISRCADPAAFH